MAKHVVLAQSPEAGAAIGTYFEVLLSPRSSADEVKTFIWEDPDNEPIATLNKFREIADWVEPLLALSSQDLVFVVDAVDPMLLSAADQGGWECLVAMLILSFPEARWAFGVVLEADADSHLVKATSFSSVLNDQRIGLFDPAGLRTWVRERTNERLTKLEYDFQIPIRGARAAIIEDEEGFAFFHGFIAYRFGCLSELVTTWSRMSALFGTAGARHDYWLLVEDMSLDFPDRKEGVELHDFQDPKHGRAHHCPQLDSTNCEVEDSDYRVLVTSGHSQGPDDDVLKRNIAYVTTAKSKGTGKVVYKPTGGVFDLWKEAGILQPKDPAAPPSASPGYAPGFMWPPSEPQGRNRLKGHGAPGKLEMIAERLIDRARSRLEQAPAVRTAVIGGTLAIDALEITGGSAPTLALDALSLKHRFEVLAECQFSGVAYRIGIKDRLAELRREVTAICKRFGADQRKDAALNAELKILVALVRIFREYGQFDEEQSCFVRIRSVRNNLWMRKPPIKFILWPFIKYLECLMRSVAIFALIILLWVIGLATFYWITTPGGTVGCSLYDSITSMFSIGAPYRPNPSCAKDAEALPVVVSFAVVWGFFHLGVFISHLYTFLSRR